MVPVAYSYRNLLVRWKTTLMTAAGFTLVVAVLIVMLAFTSGVTTVCAVSGEAENVIWLTKGNIDEVLSRIDVQTARQLELAPGVLSDDRGRALASRELYMMVTQRDEKTGRWEFMSVRGVYENALEVHTQVRLIEGRMFQRHCRELIIGRQLARAHDIRIGDRLTLGRASWDVVGICEAGGSAFESELWGDLDQLAGCFHRRGIYTAVVLRTADAATARETASYLDGSRQVAVDASCELDYYARQAEQTDLLRNAALVIGVFMAIGAALGVTNTMFAAISARTSDIAVLRIVGFTKGQILAAFLFESVLIAAIGGTLGSCLGYALNGLTLETAMGAKKVAFAFQVDAAVLSTAAVFTLVMGLLGGLLPAVSAMQIRPLESLR